MYAHYLPIFDLKYTLAVGKGSTRAGFVFGANDARLMDKNKNLYQLQSGKDQSFIKLELDISAVDGSENGKAKFNVYRVGYKDTDSPSKPMQSFDIMTSLIHQGNKHEAHTIAISNAFGEITISVDGNAFFTGAQPASQAAGFPGGRGPRGVSVNLNPVGSGGNYIPFGLLGDIGFSVDAGQKAFFSNVVVSNRRSPNNTLFREDLTLPNYQGIYAPWMGKVNSGLTMKDGKYCLEFEWAAHRR